MGKYQVLVATTRKLAEEVATDRRELGVISRGLDLCKGTLCSDVAGVRTRTWVMGELEQLQAVQLRMMEATALLRQKVSETRCAHQAQEKVAEGADEVSGGHGAAGMNASAVEGGDVGGALGTPALPTEGLSAQAEACKIGCDGAGRLAGGTPDPDCRRPLANHRPWENV